MSPGCPVCGAAAPSPFLLRRDVPVHQNLLLPDPDSARGVVRGDLDLRHCARCGFLTNVAFRPELLSYGESYENTQTASPSFDRHVDGLVKQMVDDGVRRRRVIEVGCGKGYFLERLCALGENEGLGFDPSYVGPETAAGGRVRFVREPYGRRHAGLRAQVVVCRHVIEHVPDPVALLREVREALDPSTGSVVYFETPALEWTLEGAVVWDFFYEHCSYFTALALHNAFRRARFELLETRRVFGDQYLWIKAAPAIGEGAVEAPPLAHAGLLEDCRRRAEVQSRRWDETVERLSAGGVAIWGAGAKGVTFANLLDPKRTRIRGLVDINPAKQGRFAPGTAHPIVGPGGLASLAVSDAILMNPNYLAETRRIVEDHDSGLRLHVAE